jgi:RHS repeat-associated protein
LRARRRFAHGRHYDALGRRVRETRGSTTTDLYYSDQWQVLEERVGSDVKLSYVWSPVYVDAMIARDRDTDGNGSLDERLYVLHDANFNVVALVDTSGAVVERFAYDAFGVFFVLTPSWASRSSSNYAWIYLHQGGRWDADGGVYRHWLRDYTPTLGRWLQQDPMRFAAGDVNLYRGLANRPTMFTDPTGLAVTIPVGMLVAEDVAKLQQQFSDAETRLANDLKLLGGDGPFREWLREGLATAMNRIGNSATILKWILLRALLSEKAYVLLDVDCTTKDGNVDVREGSLKATIHDTSTVFSTVASLAGIKTQATVTARDTHYHHDSVGGKVRGYATTRVTIDVKFTGKILNKDIGTLDFTAKPDTIFIVPCRCIAGDFPRAPEGGKPGGQKYLPVIIPGPGGAGGKPEYIPAIPGPPTILKPGIPGLPKPSELFPTPDFTTPPAKK